MNIIDNLILEMIGHFRGDPKRIQHFLKVLSFADIIAKNENVDEKTLFIIKTAAVVHDIGIRVCEEKYGYQNGRLQEQEGPAEAEKMLSKLGFENDVIQRVKYIVSRHHTYENVEGIDLRIILEADFLVNYYEFKLDNRQIYSSYQNIMKTKTGLDICRTMFNIKTN